jgi:hypothetical protein
MKIPYRPSTSGIRLRVVQFLLTSVWAVIAMASPHWFATAQSLPGDARPTCTVETNNAPEFATWFESGIVTANGMVRPANSVAFRDIPNCSFYQWSEQMFLWLTSPAPSKYGGGARVFSSPVFYDVSPPDFFGNRRFIRHEPSAIPSFFLRDAKVGMNGQAVIMDKAGKMFEIEAPRLSRNRKPLVLDQAGHTVEVARIVLSKDNRPIFLDPHNKGIVRPKSILRPHLKNPRTIVQKFFPENSKTAVFLDSFGKVVDVEQGQADTAVLQAQNGSLVYYAVMVNDVFAYFATGIKSGAIPSPGGVVKNAQFPTTMRELNQIISFAAAHGPTFSDPTALAIEVKTSWVEATGLANRNSYITMDATVPTYDQSDPNQWVPTGRRTVRLALVGMHVVGSTAGHPEMIWATFEHFGNSPNGAYRYDSTNGSARLRPQSTVGPWLFSASNSIGRFNQVHMQSVGPNIDATFGFTISPSDVLRMKPFGAASTNSASNTEIIAINNNIIESLADGDIRKNYIMTGATWSRGGVDPQTSQVGTNNLANTTMETYVQGGDGTARTGTNCFSCHTTNKVEVSHIFCTPLTDCARGVRPLF